MFFVNSVGFQVKWIMDFPGYFWLSGFSGVRYILFSFVCALSSTDMSLFKYVRNCDVLEPVCSGT